MWIFTRTCSLCAVFLCAGVSASEPPSLAQIAAAPDAAQLRSTVTALVGFGTRHTASDTASTTRGIGAARHWARTRLEQISADCGQCLALVEPAQTITDDEMPAPTPVVDVVAIQKGYADPDRVIVLSGHIDSRVSDLRNASADAPGADDDASGVAVVIEAARILSRYRFPATIVYGVLSGEEQGLYGGKILAQYAKAQGWRVEADLNNDIVGSPKGQNGVTNNTRVRVFSEGTRAAESADEARQRQQEGGEDDSASRNLARYVKATAERYLPNWSIALVYRPDRMDRGGDHLAFNESGYPAVRFTESAEDYRHQHQDLRTQDGIAYGDTIDHLDFAYLARVAASNALAAAAMALAPPPPATVKLTGAVSPDAQLAWKPAPGTTLASTYRVYWRETIETAWTHARDVGRAQSATLSNVVVDDYCFGVASVSADGIESPVVYAGPPGAFP